MGHPGRDHVPEGSCGRGVVSTGPSSTGCSRSAAYAAWPDAIADCDGMCHYRGTHRVSARWAAAVHDCGP
jgi:hypothetical protein